MTKVSTFSERLNLALKNTGISAAELSRKTGLSKSLISKYVHGTIEAGSTSLYLLAKALKADPVWLMGYETDSDVKDASPEKEMRLLEIQRICSDQDEQTLDMIIDLIKAVINRK